MSAILAITRKDLRLMFRDKGEMFFTFLFPMILATFFGFIFGGGSDGGSKIEVALAVESDSKLAAGIAGDLQADVAFEVVSVQTRLLATDLVRAGKVTAAVILPASMQDGMGNLFGGGGGIPIEAIVDPSRRAEVGLIQGKLNELAFRQFPKLFSDGDAMTQFASTARTSVAQSSSLTPGQKLAASALIAAGDSLSKSLITDAAPADGEASGSGVAGWSPVAITIQELPAKKGGPRNAFDVSFPQGIVWGLAGCVMAFATSLVAERMRGTLDRLRLAPITRSQLLAGKGLACFITALLVQVLLLGLAIVAFGSTVEQPFMLCVAFVATAFAFSGLSMLIAGACRTEAQAQGAGRGALLLLAMIGGGTIPLFLMPPFFKSVSMASPFRWAVSAIEGPFWRGSNLSDQLLPLAILTAIGIVGFTVGVRATRSAAR